MNIQSLNQSFKEYTNIPQHWLKQWLVYVINKSDVFLITNPEYQLTDSEKQKLSDGINQMISGVPLAYLIGKQAFWSLEFIVNEYTLIPRPDTEILIETVLNWIQDNVEIQEKWLAENDSDQLNLLDLGTGSGCIAISLAYELSRTVPTNYSLSKTQSYVNTHNIANWQVTAVDFSKEALKVTEKNIKHNAVDNISTVHSDWFNNLDMTKKYAVIVSNPPYIDPEDEHLKSLKKEPITALTADKKGLADIEKIILGSKEFLLKFGLLAIEHGYDQAESVRSIFKNSGFSSVHTIKDYGGNDRVTLGIFEVKS